MIKNDFILPLKIILTHCGLATGAVVYSIFSREANPIHALTIFTFTTAFVLILTDKHVLSLLKQKQYISICALSGFFYSIYFTCLLVGISQAGPSTVALFLSLTICTNGLVTIYARHGRVEINLLLFLLVLFIVILLLKTKGNLHWSEFDISFFMLAGCVLAESANTYLRVVWTKKRGVLKKASETLPKCGLVISVIPTVCILFVDALFFSDLTATLNKWLSYDLYTYLSWLYLGIVPNLIMLTFAVRYEMENSLLFQSLSSVKFLFSSISILFIPFLAETSVFYDGSPLVYGLSIVLTVLIYLYNIHDGLIGRLKGLTKP